MDCWKRWAFLFSSEKQLFSPFYFVRLGYLFIGSGQCNGASSGAWLVFTRAAATTHELPETQTINLHSRVHCCKSGESRRQCPHWHHGGAGNKSLSLPFLFICLLFFPLAICLKEYMIFQMERITADIRDFRQASGVDKVIVLWTANTERFCDIIPGVNDSAKNLLAAIQVRSMAIRINPESSLSANHNNEPT